MADEDLSWRPGNYSMIDIYDPLQIRYWTREFGVTENQLREAVKKVGMSSSAVRRNLKFRDDKMPR